MTLTTKQKIASVFIGLFIVAQFIRFDNSNLKLDQENEINTPNEVKDILKRSCYDCHSNQTKWPWYSNVAPISWLVGKDVNDARLWLNFSEWNTYNNETQNKLKKLIYKEVSTAMPPHLYTIIHSDAKLSESDKNTIKEWTGIKLKDL